MSYLFFFYKCSSPLIALFIFSYIFSEQDNAEEDSTFYIQHVPLKKIVDFFHDYCFILHIVNRLVFYPHIFKTYLGSILGAETNIFLYLFGGWLNFLFPLVSVSTIHLHPHVNGSI